MSMDPQLKTRWIAALRSGEYKQGKNRLKRVDDNSYCCLGVLCDVVQPDGWDRGAHILGSKDNTSLLDGELLGIPEATEKTLMDMNDGWPDPSETLREFTFNEIADYIEANL